jgi:flagellin FlaB
MSTTTNNANNVRRNGSSKDEKKRAVIGVESAIVLIAFVIVAAALAFVVLNMGFNTTQKAKTTITSGLNEASSALEVSGVVTGSGDIPSAKLKVLAVPIKVASGGSSVNLEKATAAIKYFSKSVSYDNLYRGTISNVTVSNLQDGVQYAVNRGYISSNPVNGTAPTATGAFIYWSTGVDPVP